MTIAEALSAMKRKCKLLAEVFTDEELTGFLADYQVTEDAVTTYNIRQSIYDALTSAMSSEAQSFSRGGVSVTKVDLQKVRSAYSTAGTISCVRPDVEIAVSSDQIGSYRP